MLSYEALLYASSYILISARNRSNIVIRLYIEGITTKRINNIHGIISTPCIRGYVIVTLTHRIYGSRTHDWRIVHTCLAVVFI